MTSAVAKGFTSARHIQQRHILDMMGIECWVGRKTPTLRVDTSALLGHQLNQQPSPSLISSTPSSEQSYIRSSIQSPAQPSLPSSDTAQSIPSTELSASQPSIATTLGVQSSDTSQLEESRFTQHQFVSPVSDMQAKDTAIQQTGQHKPSDMFAQMYKVQQPDSQPKLQPVNANVEEKVVQRIAPFSLLGIQFRGWVLLVDSKQLQDSACQQLWRNIVQALSATERELRFPICAGMDSLEIANASLAGFVFCMAQDDKKQVAGLTVLPDGLTHERLCQLPSLQQMLTDASQKRKLWQLLSTQ
ncbi:hypothetical protein [Psychrobacter sp. I-STPA6b]|uniref:hypothetical protein n=1 Tax=Psychrobacter sp. I-STPA6b TaxID=2585718 RepID=UPI001D0CC6DC|nr:hypothetical protein [Psychrobacter sp. I-STPA6b]